MLLWCLIVPHVSNVGNDGYKPYGIKVWSGFLLIFVSLIPIVNIAAVIVMITFISMNAYINNISWNKAFPHGTILSKLKNLLNKKLL